MEGLRRLYGIYGIQPKFRIPYSCYRPSAPGLDIDSNFDEEPKPVE